MRNHAWLLQSCTPYKCVVEYLKDRRHHVDDLSRELNIEIPYERTVAWVLATISVKPYSNLMQVIIETKVSD